MNEEVLSWGEIAFRLSALLKHQDGRMCLSLAFSPRTHLCKPQEEELVIGETQGGQCLLGPVLLHPVLVGLGGEKTDLRAPVTREQAGW